MISKDFNTYITDNDDGMLLLAAIAILTTINKQNIINNDYGSKACPNEVFDKIQNLANKLFYEEEYKNEQVRLKRENKINKLLGN